MKRGIKKLQKGKSYKYNINRKRLNKKRNNVGKIKCPVIREAWSDKKSISRNLDVMGLSSNPNHTLTIPSYKSERLKMEKLVNGFIETDNINIEESKKEDIVKKRKPKQYVAEKLAEDAAEYRGSFFKLPKGIVAHVTYMMNKYGFNYKAMERDIKNYDQETWKQLRAKVKKFISIPEQFNEFLKVNNITELDKNDTKWQEVGSDDEV